MINFCKNKLKNYSLIYGKEQTISLPVRYGIINKIACIKEPPS
jgi:hypothetical protein